MHKSGDIDKGCSVVTFMLFRLKVGRAWWAFRQMGLAVNYFKNYRNLNFGELLGTGHGRGFSVKPHFRQYAILTSWKNREAAQNFLRNDELVSQFMKRSEEVYSVEMLPVYSKGSWKGINPFTPFLPTTENTNTPMVVLTRARIKWSKLFQFWKNVPKVSRSTDKAEGLLAKIGVGEKPLIHQATVSIWKDADSLKQFAYKMAEHKKVIEKTRQLGWYSEELFARFIPVHSEGTWQGKDPLKDLLITKEPVSGEQKKREKASSS